MSGDCEPTEGNASAGTSAVSLTLLLAPLAMIGGLKWRNRRRGSGDSA